MDAEELRQFRPDAEGALERYAAQIQELVLWIRDEGHVLSSMDQHFVEQWWEAGYPLDSILGALRESGLRLKRRKNPPRGLPLRSMKRWVVKAGERARGGAVGRHREDEDQAGAEGGDRLTSLRADVEAMIASSASSTEGPLEAARDALNSLVEASSSESELFAALLGVGRRYYDACWTALPPAQRAAHRDEVRQALGEALQTMDPEAAEATIQELCRRRLRSRDGLFDPDRYWKNS